MKRFIQIDKLFDNREILESDLGRNWFREVVPSKWNLFRYFFGINLADADISVHLDASAYSQRYSTKGNQLWFFSYNERWIEENLFKFGHKFFLGGRATISRRC